MRQAGLSRSSCGCPVSPVASEPAARAFLTRIVWPEIEHAVGSHGRAAGMSDADVARAEEFLDLNSRAWIGAGPDAFAVQPALLRAGRAVPEISTAPGRHVEVAGRADRPTTHRMAPDGHLGHGIQK
jgi:hypothetical protein